ncbi:hypothetical protein ANN_15190 [Periplaneta americana]|uniref:Uncharacterized protein n=1 Tax=Periplaneta americana TaxID=6978 RepID=A0ABQ8SFZ5_PERAM|nr:hypothetical protein ANN_15190 [Periplaneta americana]
MRQQCIQLGKDSRKSKTGRPIFKNNSRKTSQNSDNRKIQKPSQESVKLFSVDENGDSEMVFGKMRPRIRHRLPGIHLTVGENLGKTQPVKLLNIKSMAFIGILPKRMKILIGSNVVEQVTSFNYLGCTVSYLRNMDMEKNVGKFQQICDTIKSLRNITTEEAYLKLYKTMAVQYTHMDQRHGLKKKRIETTEMHF